MALSLAINFMKNISRKKVKGMTTLVGMSPSQVVGMTRVTNDAIVSAT
jgi:hypothetical protein